MERLDDERLQEAVRRLREGLSPKAVYLYGSHAYGTPHADSDVDLFVVVESLEEPWYEVEARAYGLLAGLKLPAQIRVVTEEEYEKRRHWVASLEREVDERGVQLYAAG